MFNFMENAKGLLMYLLYWIYLPKAINIFTAIEPNEFGFPINVFVYQCICVHSLIITDDNHNFRPFFVLFWLLFVNLRKFNMRVMRKFCYFIIKTLTKIQWFQYHRKKNHSFHAFYLLYNMFDNCFCGLYLWITKVTEIFM